MPSEANDRSSFKDQVVNSIEETFSNLGLEITAFQITRISDKNGYYDSLSAKEIADKQSEARKAKAEADKRATLVETENWQEAEQAKLESDKRVAQNQRDVNVAKAKFDAEVKREQEIAKQAENIARAEQEEIVRAKQVAVKQNELKGTVIAEQKARAEAITIQAEAEASALKLKIEAQAIADASATKLKAAANAEKIEKEGQAQAQAQQALAKALEENGKFALQKAIIDSLPQIADSFASAVSNIDNLTVFDGAEGVGRQSTAGLSQTLAFVKQATGIDLADYINKRAAGTVTLNDPVPVKENN